MFVKEHCFFLHDTDSYHRADSHLSVSFLDASFYCFRKESPFSLKCLKFRLLKVIPPLLFLFFSLKAGVLNKE